jgi:hypothetical protein
MNSYRKILSTGLVTLAVSGLSCVSARAQSPATVVPVVVDTAIPIVVNAVKPKQPAGTAKFQGLVMHANTAEITARAKGNETAIMTFSLSQAASAKMQQIMDKGGYQYGDKVTIFYDPATQQVVKFTGKPSKPI